DVSEREELWDDIARLEDANTELQAENTALKKRTESAESDWQLAEAENETLHKKLRILRNAKCPKCDFRFKIQKLSNDAD
ncbi:hypothetical protein LCGC14_0878000, partial [marine sediment metagenome]